MDLYIEAGGNYFDTAYTYYYGKSEDALKRSVIDRYPREKVKIANKMPVYEMSIEDNPEEIFEEQLRRCGVDYFDYYLLHNLEYECYKGVCEDLKIIELLKKYKEEGKIKKLGFSIHDTPEALDKILSEHPEMEFVQLQINYADWNNPYVESEKMYEVACKHDKPVMIMEPLMGGKLAKLPAKVEKIFEDYDDLKHATLAFSYVFSLENVEMILSGMNQIDVMKENLEFISNFEKISDTEVNLINKINSILEEIKTINCSYCNYCINECPQQIPISSYFRLYNETVEEEKITKKHRQKYHELSEIRKLPDCLICERCEEVCPQHLVITEELEKVYYTFEQ